MCDTTAQYTLSYIYLTLYTFTFEWILVYIYFIYTITHRKCQTFTHPNSKKKHKRTNEKKTSMCLLFHYPQSILKWFCICIWCIIDRYCISINSSILLLCCLADCTLGVNNYFFFLIYFWIIWNYYIFHHFSGFEMFL